MSPKGGAYRATEVQREQRSAVWCGPVPWARCSRGQSTGVSRTKGGHVLQVVQRRREDILEGTSRGHRSVDTTSAEGDLSADLEKALSDGMALGSCHGRALEPDAPQFV